jgi:hypothetical protein
MSGMNIYQEAASGTGEMTKQINLTAYPAGVYYLQIISDNTTIESQAIVKN